ncbi:Ulp1 family isopeptidase [Bradyrhizobium sp. LMTR 3]|uniref:Ulp1 family isopeptidase n=1 Tax=Bradyrhizobium sp. LMTR 3 TaxID=189873 RepID=UPI0008104ED6|nr:Ulp1 family isopeptidase [Bradyrhizobium sp. LMTR 3]OCK53937.1 hypothetical protein LMTR3_22365 [Bradyrhizobium sp. LMTR 3]
MAPFNNINPFDRDFAAYDSTVQQQQRQQAEFEQHLGEMPQVDAANLGREPFDISEEDDRLIQAAAAAARDRGVPPSTVTVGIYDRRLRKLADALKRRSGESIATLDDESLLDHAKRLFPNDKVIVPALSMLSRYRDPGAPARPITTHYRASKEDDRLIRAAAEAGFGRGIDRKTAENYSSNLRKLSAALRPFSIAMLGHDSLVGHAKRLFPNDNKLIYALNRLREYRESTGQGTSRGEGGSSRLPLEPAAHSPVRSFGQEQLLGSAADLGGAVPADRFDAPELWQGMGAAPLWPVQSVDQEEHLDAVDLGGPLPADRFDLASTNWGRQQSGSAGGQESSPAPPSADAVAFGWQLSEIGNSGDRVLMQAPIHRVGASPWEAQPVMQGSGHEYISAPHGGGGGAMLDASALQPGQSIGVYVGDSARPLYSEDASLILGLEETISGSNGEHLLDLGRWLFENNKPGIAARLDDETLTEDVEEFERNGGSSYVATALAHLKASLSAGVAPPIVERAVLNPYPEDTALIEAYKAAPAEGIIQDTVSNYAKRLRRFSDHLRKKNKPRIAARLHDKSLDKDGKDYKDSGGLDISAALAHVRKSLPRAGALELGQHSARVPHPEDAVARRVGDAAAQHSASDGAVNWPEVLLPAERHDQDVVSGMMYEADPSLPFEPTARHNQAPDPGEAVHPLNWPRDHQPAPDELTGSNLLPRDEVPIDEDYTGQLRPAKRRRTLSNPQGDAIGRQLSEIGNSGDRVLMQASIHQLGASPWESQPMMQGSGHEYIPAPHDGGGGAMLDASALQPGQSTGVLVGRSKRPVYSEDAPLILGLEKALIKGGAKELTAKSRVGQLLSLDRWLFEKNKPGIAARLYDKSLDNDVEEFLERGGAPHARTALAHLKASQSAGGAAPIVSRAVLNPYPGDAALIKDFAAASGKRTYATALRAFGHYLRENNKPGIAARLYDKSLDEDAEHYEASGGSEYASEALSHLRGSPLKFERRYSRIATPEDAVLIEAANKWALAAATSQTEREAVWRRASSVRGFSQWLQHNGREPIIGRLNNPDALKTDLNDFKRATNETQVGKGLELLRKYQQAVGANNPLGLQYLEHGAVGSPVVLPAEGYDQDPPWGVMEEAGPPSPLGPAVGSPVVLPAEGYDQDPLWGVIDEAGPPSSLGPTARHSQAPDFGEAVRHLNWRHGHQRAPDELIAALDWSNLLPTQETPLTSFFVNGEHYTAGLMPAGVTRQSTPLNPRGVAIRLRYRPEGAPQPSSRPENPASPELFGRTMEPTGPACARAAAASPAVDETFDVSFAAPEDFSHRTQPVPDRMLSRLRQFGFLPSAAQRVMSYDIRGERYTAILGPGGPNDVQLIHHPRVGSEAAPAAPARARSDIYSGLESLVDLTSTPQELRDDGNYPSVFSRTLSDAQIGDLGPTASLHDRSGLELGARDWLGDEHIAADYALLEQELRRDNPNLAARTRFVDPLVAHYHLRLGTESIALGAFQRIVHNQNGSDTADFLFLPVNDASATDPNRRGTHWSLLLVDRREQARPVAYHYDSYGITNRAIAAELAQRLGARLEPARMAQQRNGYDCGVFVVDGTRALVGRLAQGEGSEHEPLHLDNLVADRQALQDRLRAHPG